jgi:hypothetical protein
MSSCRTQRCLTRSPTSRSPRITWRVYSYLMASDEDAGRVMSRNSRRRANAGVQLEGVLFDMDSSRLFG